MEKYLLKPLCCLALACCLDTGLPLSAQAATTNTLIKVGNYKPSASATLFKVAGNYVYIAESTGLEIVNVTNPTNCVHVGSYAVSGGVNDFSLAGKYAYIAKAGGLDIVDVSNPTNCVSVGSYATQNPAAGVAVAGDYAYVTGNQYIAGLHLYGGLLQVINISNPANCVLAYNCGDTTGYFQGVHVALVGDYAYVSSAGTFGGVTIFDVGNPTLPSIVGNTSVTCGNPNVLSVAGSYAYAADYSLVINVMDISDASHPVVLGHFFKMSGLACDVAVAGDYAYAAYQSGGLLVINVRNPANCVETGVYDTGGQTIGVNVSENNVYALDSKAGLQVYSISTSPVVPLPRAATATAQAVNGFVVGITIADPGYGYANTPSVIIQGDGTGATAHAVVSNGILTQIIIDNPGHSYTNPIVSIIPPWSSSAPSLKIEVSKVKISMAVTAGYNYMLESSTNMNTWTQVGSVFTATRNTIVQEFDVNETGRFFRLSEVK